MAVRLTVDDKSAIFKGAEDLRLRGAAQLALHFINAHIKRKLVINALPRHEK